MARPWQVTAVADGAATAEAPKPITDDASTADREGATATTASAKQDVLSALKAGSEVEVRAALTTALPALEATNPTPQAELSELLSGKWTVKYTGGVAKGPVDSPTREIALLMYAAGFGPGAAALSLANRLPDQWVRVKTVSLEITQFPFQSRSILALSLPRTRGGRSTVEAELLCDLSAEGPRISETGKEVRVVGNFAKLLDGKGKNTPDLQVNGGEPIAIPEQFRYTRDIFVTYLDDDLLVARDATGSPDILLRDRTAPRIPIVEPDAILSG